MARQPKLFVHIDSTNLTPNRNVSYEIVATTHHWRGELLDTWAKATLKYEDIYRTGDAFTCLKQKFLALQEMMEPSQDIIIPLLGKDKETEPVSEEDREYFGVVKLATSKGWHWEESFTENLVTGERKTLGGTKPYSLSLGTWQWGGRNLGSSVGFSHFQKEGESKASHLLRILETAEKAKHDFPESIPYTNIYGEIKKDDFKTRIVFGS